MKSWAAAASAVVMTAFFALVIWSSYQVFALDRDDLYAENGLIENIQAALLIFACLAFLGPVLFEKRSDKVILLFCALLATPLCSGNSMLKIWTFLMPSSS